jgi:hypothetical protein
MYLATVKMMIMSPVEFQLQNSLRVLQHGRHVKVSYCLPVHKEDYGEEVKRERCAAQSADG